MTNRWYKRRGVWVPMVPIAGGADWPLQDGQRFETEGALTAGNTDGTLVSAGSPANTKGSWVQMVASTGFACQGFFIAFDNGTGESLWDVGVGAAGSEVILVPNILEFVPGEGNYVYIPIGIPAGTRIALRNQNTTGSASTGRACIYLVGGTLNSMSSYGRAVCFGADTANTRGARISDASSANTKTSWVVITSSTDIAVKAITVMFLGGSGRKLVDIAVGATGSEQVILSNLLFGASGSTTVFVGPIPCAIPAGTQIQARLQDLNAPTTTHDIAILGFA